ncbi:MAG: PhzF family phenazine biosynthesis protein [Bacteroidota bacterium]
MTTIDLYQVDAFTDHVFGGNPAAVCPLESWLPDDVLQKIAIENNLAETAFFVPVENGYHLRWFTPGFEIDLCGHATLGTAHVLWQHLAAQEEELRFETRSGTLLVKKAGDQYLMDFPSRPPEACELPEALERAMGITPSYVAKSRDYFLVYESESVIASLEPNFHAMLEVDTVGVIATAKGDQVDFVSRFFAPAAGIPEDPVTGSAHCNLIPYWAEQLGKTQMDAWQISPRKGILSCELKGDRVLMGGKAVTFLVGKVFL